MGLVNLRGIYTYMKKQTKGVSIKKIDAGDYVNVPLAVDGIVASDPAVEIGDEVKCGSLIGKPVGKFGLNIFSPVAGKVLNIFDKKNEKGEDVKHVLILNNKTDEVENLPEIESITDLALLARLSECGLVDTLAKMPTYLKYAYVGSRSYNKLLILMDSCSPNNTVNESIILEHMEEVINGAKYFMNFTNAPLITFIFSESNYKLAMKLKKHILESKKNYDFKIKFIPNKYPFDNPYILAKIVCGKSVGNRISFLDVGVTIETAESCYNFCRAVEFNRPVTSKIVTIDGSNIENKGNYQIPIGMSTNDVLNCVGINDKEAFSRLIFGNLLCGRTLEDGGAVVSILTDSIVFEKQDILEDMQEHPCISCGKCSSICPMFLKPNELDDAFIEGDIGFMEKNGVNSCIACGCCSYVCPAKRHLTQRIAAGKYYDSKKRGERL